MWWVVGFEADFRVPSFVRPQGTLRGFRSRLPASCFHSVAVCFSKGAVEQGSLASLSSQAFRGNRGWNGLSWRPPHEFHG